MSAGCPQASGGSSARAAEPAPTRSDASASVRDVSLISRQAYRLGYDPMPMDRAIEATVRRAAPESAD